MRLRGAFRLQIGDREVLAAEVKDAKALRKEGAEVRLEAGVLPFSAEFTRLPGEARVELLNAVQDVYLSKEITIA